MVYAKAPFAGPEAVLAYLSLYTHRVAISNGRLIAFDEAGVTFRYKDYRRSGPHRQQVMTLDAHEFIRRFLMHVLPHGFHRIRHYGLFASATRKANLARVRELLAVAPPPQDVDAEGTARHPLRPVLAAAGACASSRPSSAGDSPAHLRPAPCQMERALRDPARPGFATPRSAGASGSDRARQTTSAAPAGHNPTALRTE